MGLLGIANPTWIKTEMVHELVIITIDLKTTDINQEQHCTLRRRASFEYLDKLKSSLADSGCPAPSSENAPQILSDSQAG